MYWGPGDKLKDHWGDTYSSCLTMWAGWNDEVIDNFDSWVRFGLTARKWWNDGQMAISIGEWMV